MKMIDQSEWFLGHINTIEAKNRLFGADPGTFLVRFSNSNPGCYGNEFFQVNYL